MPVKQMPERQISVQCSVAGLEIQMCITLLVEKQSPLNLQLIFGD